MKNLDLLLPAGSTDNGDSWYWATVTQVSPLRVRLDGDDAALPITPESLTYGLTVGKRVWVQMAGHRVIVHGVTGGYAAAPAVHTHDYAASNHTHSANRLNATTTYASDTGGGGSWPNGSIATTGLWEPGPTWPAGCNAALVHMSVNARSDVNAAAYWEMLFHNGSGWERLGFQRVHNNAQPTLGVGVSLTQILDRDRTWLGDCRLALNVHIDSGGGWIAAGPTSMQVSFLTNTA